MGRLAQRGLQLKTGFQRSSLSCTINVGLLTKLIFIPPPSVLLFNSPSYFFIFLLSRLFFLSVFSFFSFPFLSLHSLLLPLSFPTLLTPTLIIVPPPNFFVFSTSHSLCRYIHFCFFFQDDRLRTPLLKLKLAVCSVMPEQIARYNMDCMAKVAK